MNKLSLALTSGFLYVLASSNLSAQSTAPKTANNNVIAQQEKNKEDQDKKAAAQRGAELEKNSACKNIINECKKLGFVAGQFKEGNGLWRGCVGPVLEGKPTIQKGKAVKVAANANDIAACKAFSEKNKNTNNSASSVGK